MKPLLVLLLSLGALTSLPAVERTNSPGPRLRKIVRADHTTNLLVRIGSQQVRIADTWNASGQTLEITTNGAVGQFGPHQVLLAPNLNSSGAIFLQTADGKRLRSHPLALAYYDAATGRSVLLATLKDTRGQWVPPNQIIYRDAFDDLKADVRYTYNQNSFEQDVILRQRPPSPAEYGLNVATTRLEIWTEFLQPPAPLKQPRTIALRIPDETPTRREVFAVDESLSFGAMKVVTGGAFPIQMPLPAATNGVTAVQRKVPVSKSWQQVDGRYFLIEAVDYLTARSHLRRLSAPTNSPAARQAAGSASPVRRVASAARTFPAAPAVKPPVDSIQLARNNPGSKGGFVLDYIIVNAAITNQVWVEDKGNLPAGAVLYAAGGDSWNWTTNDPMPVSGTNAHQSANRAGFHQHSFGQATVTLPVTGGDRMYAYVYLDATNPPAEVMLQWQEAELRWVQYWVAYPEPQYECWSEWVEDGYQEDGYCDNGYWDPEPSYDDDGNEIDPGNWVDGQCYDGDWVDTSHWEEVCDYVDGYWAGYWQWSWNWNHRAYWGVSNTNLLVNGAGSGRYMGPLPPVGQWVRLEVPASTVGLTDRLISGMAFTLYNGKATWDYAGKMNQQPDIVWVEDAIPTGGISAASGGDSWNWINSGPSPVSESLSHQSANAAGRHEHWFSNATATLTIDANDGLYSYVYLDPTNPPTEVMLQWCESPANWEHRAYWGANSITNVGVNGSESRRYMGALPPTGQWARLELPASAVGLEGRTLNGMSFSAFGGRATWDNAGKSRVLVSDVDGDGLPDTWERQYFGDSRYGPNDDPDGDGLTNAQEFQLGTNPDKADTDGDGMPDGWEVAHGLNPFANDANGDPDYDGGTNYDEYLRGTNPFDSNSYTSGRLGCWHFNTTSYLGERGQAPLSSLNLTSVPGWSGNAVGVNTINTGNNSGGQLVYRDVETNGAANFNVKRGTVRFWFKPDWTSANAGGSGPPGEPRVMEMGSYGNTNGWWAIYIKAGTGGSEWWMGSSTNALSEGKYQYALLATNSWLSNQWCQFVLTYSATNRITYINGVPVRTNAGILYYPNLAMRSNGFSVGNSLVGNYLPVNGFFDELETFNYPLSAAEVRDNYNTVGPKTFGPRFEWGSRDANGQFTFALTGEPSGATWGVDATTNFINWTTLGGIQLTNGSVYFTDTQATNFRYRFYRATNECLRSANLYGYVSVTCPKGDTLLANQLLATNSTVPSLFVGAPAGAVVTKFDETTQQYIADALFTTWTDPNLTLVPGEGAFFNNPATNPWRVTFVGDVPEGTLTNLLPATFAIRSSILPKPGFLSTDLALPTTGSPQAYQWNGSNYFIFRFFPNSGAWYPSEPSIKVGESFFVFRTNTAAWVQQLFPPGDFDTDGDGLPDCWEFAHFGNLNQKAGGDPDGDGLPNFLEMRWRTNPTNPDSDGDGFTDLWENQNGMFPALNEAASQGYWLQYQYDTVGRLKKVGALQQKAVTYDAEGNIQSVTP